MRNQVGQEDPDDERQCGAYGKERNIEIGMRRPAGRVVYPRIETSQVEQDREQQDNHEWNDTCTGG